MSEQKTLVIKFQAGTVSAAIWKNTANVNGKKVTILKTTVQRRYKDNDGWKSSNSFGRNEIPLALYCLQQAFEKMIELQNKSSGNSRDTEEISID
jgi:hypothetical protein